MKKEKAGLYANIHAKQERIKNGSKEKMRVPGSEGAPKDNDFVKAEKGSEKSKSKK